MKYFIVKTLALALFLVPSVWAHDSAAMNDYPTAVRAEYVFACMKSNGENPISLINCSCSIDFIAEEISYDDYIAADTVLRTQQDEGQRGNLFRELPFAKRIIDRFRRVQALSSLECFK